MRSGKLSFGILLLITLFASTALAAEQPEAQAVKTESGNVQPSESEQAISPMMREILDYWAIQEARITQLEEEYDAAVNETSAISIRQEIEETLKTTELEVLRIQLRYAIAEDRTETAAQLEEAIQKILSPPVLPPAEERPEPTDETH